MMVTEMEKHRRDEGTMGFIFFSHPGFLFLLFSSHPRATTITAAAAKTTATVIAVVVVDPGKFWMFFCVFVLCIREFTHKSGV